MISRRRLTAKEEAFAELDEYGWTETGFPAALNSLKSDLYPFQTDL